MVLQPLAFIGTNISFSAFNSTVRTPEHNASNQVRKERVSRNTKMKRGSYWDAFLLVSRRWSHGCR